MSILQLKRVDVSYHANREEIKSLQKVINLQQIENEKLQETVLVLENELVSMKKTLDSYQIQVDVATTTNNELKQENKTLIENLHEAKMQHGAFDVLSNQMKEVLEKYVNLKKENSALKEELTKYIVETNDLRLSVQEKATEFTEKEIELSSELRYYRDKLIIANVDTSKQRDTIKLLKTELQHLKQQIIWADETRSEQIARSRQSEYRTLLRVDEVSRTLQSIKDERDIMKEALALSSLHGELLLDKLRSTEEDATLGKEALQSMVSRTTDAQNIARRQESVIRKQVEVLQEQVILYKQGFLELAEKNQQLQDEVMRLQKHIKGKNFAAVEKNLKPTATRLGNSKGMLPNVHNLKSQNSNNCETFGRGSQILEAPNSLNSLSSPALLEDFHIGGSDSVNRSLSADDALVGQEEESTSLSDMLQYQGKRCLLIRYLRQFVTVFNTLALPETLKTTTLDFSRCALTDEDMTQVIEWLRLLPIAVVEKIDFSSNILTYRGASLLATWLLALEPKDYLQRLGTLHIDYTFNMIGEDIIPNILAQFIRTPRSEFKHVETECDGSVIVVYGIKASGTSRKGSAILRWDFRHGITKSSQSLALKNS